MRKALVHKGESTDFPAQFGLARGRFEIRSDETFDLGAII
jgi:hypothetical protein